MKQHLQKSDRVRLGGKWLTKPPKAKWLTGKQPVGWARVEREKA